MFVFLITVNEGNYILFSDPEEFLGELRALHKWKRTAAHSRLEERILGHVVFLKVFNPRDPYVLVRPWEFVPKVYWVFVGFPAEVSDQTNSILQFK